MAVIRNFFRFCRSGVLFFLLCIGLTGPGRAWAQEGPEVFYPPGMEPPPAASGPVAPAPASPPAASSAAAPVSAAAPAVMTETAAPAETRAPGPAEGETPELPRSYRGISLGMGLEDLKGALRNDPLFHFRGDRDVSFVPSSVRSGAVEDVQNLVETTGPSFIRRAFFQLRNGELFIMAYALHTGLVDHYSVFMGLRAKYGEPSRLDPREAVWEAGDTRVSIERPLTVKYIDLRVFNELIGESALVESGEFRRRQEFLGEF